MSENPDQHRVDERATDLLPEEIAAGSDDPEAQARILLEDSDRRTDEGEHSGDDADAGDGAGPGDGEAGGTFGNAGR